MDFHLLVSLISKMDIHRMFWSLYEEHSPEQWVKDYEQLRYAHYTFCSGDSERAGMSHTIQQIFDGSKPSELAEWSISLAMTDSKAEVTCYSRFIYLDHPHCLRFPNFYERKSESIYDLPAILHEGAESLMTHLMTTLREKRCHSEWQEAQALAYEKLKDFEASRRSESVL